MMRERGVQRDDPSPPVPDMQEHIAHLRTYLQDRRDRVDCRHAPCDRYALERQFGFTDKPATAMAPLLVRDVAIDLGHPTTSSYATVLCAHDSSRVHAGHVTLLGPDFDEMAVGARVPFAQVVVLAVREGMRAAYWELLQPQTLQGRLPGYMARASSGRLWVRLSMSARARGLSLWAIGSALCMAYSEAFAEVAAVEVILCTACSDDIAALGSLAVDTALVFSQAARKQRGGERHSDNNSCVLEDCEECDNRPVCDNVRRIHAERAKEQPRGGTANA